MNYCNQRFQTFFRRQNDVTDRGYGARLPFWTELQGKQHIYSGDNLNARWLSGAKEQINSDHVNIAKCRLQLFDLVIADKLYDYAVKKVMCPLNNWKGMGLCDDEISEEDHKSKPDPMVGVDPLLIGAWLERLRPSFDIYDYARILSWKQLQDQGVTDLPKLSEVPSYMETLAKYTNITFSDAHFKKIKRVSLKNEGHFHPLIEFCDRMKQVWSNNPDGEYQKSDCAKGAISLSLILSCFFHVFPLLLFKEVPNVFGIGTITWFPK